MPIGLGIGLNISMRGGLGSGFALDALTLAWSTAASDNTPGFEVSGDSLDVAPVDAQIELQVADDVNFTPPPSDTELSAVTGNPVSMAVSPALSDGQYWARARLLDSGDAPLTDWSNVVTETIVTSSAEFSQYFTRTSGLTGAEETALEAFIDGLVADSLWSKIDWLHVYGLGTAGDAVLNLKSSSYPAVPTNSPTFTANQGYTGNGSNMYLDTGFDPSTAGGQYAQNSASVFVYSRVDAASITAMIGNTNAASQSYISPRFSNLTFMGANGSAISASNTNATGFYHATRRGAADSEFYKNGTSLTTSGTASTALQNNNLTTLRALGAYSVGQVSLAGAGAGMNDTEAAALAARVATLQTALGW